MAGKPAKAFVLLCVSASLLITGCSSSGPPPPSATIAITSPSESPTLEQGQSVSITAGVYGNVSNQNVNWSISGCPVLAGSCGTLTNVTGTSVTYNAPPSVSTTLNATVRATSQASPLLAAYLRITVAAVAVTIINKVSEIPATTLSNPGYFFPFPQSGFQANVANDPDMAGVTWTLTANGAACSPACGTMQVITPTPNTSEVRYTPPASVPASPDNQPTITAASVTDPSKSDSDTFTLFDGASACGTQGNESLLNGQYAIMLQGFGGANPNGQPAQAGRGISNAAVYTAVFDADGTGKISGGTDQVYQIYSGGGYGVGRGILPAASSYSVGPDGRGCMVLTDGYGVTEQLRFSLGGVSGGVAGKGDVILSAQQEEWNPLSASGILRRQDVSAFALTSIPAYFTIGVDGWESSKSPLAHFAAAGYAPTSNSCAYFPSSVANDGGNLGSLVMGDCLSMDLQTINNPYGLTSATLSLAGPDTGTINVQAIVINSSELFLFAEDSFDGLNGFGGLIFSGLAIATPSAVTSQTSPTWSTLASLLPGSYIFRYSGSESGAASAAIGVASFSKATLAAGTLNGTLDQYTVGAPATSSLNGTYGFGYYTLFISQEIEDVDLYSGGGQPSQVLFLTSPVDGISAFGIAADSASSLGVFEAQPAATYSDASLSRNFFFGSGEPGDTTVPDSIGAASIAGGNVQGTEDLASPSGFSLGAPFSAPLTINADGTGGLGPNTVAVTNGTKLFFINEAAGAPAAVQVFEP